MKLATISLGRGEEAAIVTSGGLAPIRRINEAAGAGWSTEMLGLLTGGEHERLQAWCRGSGRELLNRLTEVPLAEAVYRPLYRRPRKIWGIGANYAAKAGAMQVIPPEAEPICFMKPDTSLIGPGDSIVLPRGQGRITAEAELGIVIGRACKNVSEREAREVVAGFTPTLDMTAQDIHARNPRFLGRAKCFDTFFSFGPHLMTWDELNDPDALQVQTVLNGKVVHRAEAGEMTYSPWLIVSYFSKMMTLLPGDVIMTGTPGSVELADGDTVECRLGDFTALVNPVRAERE
ncbi:fumarylacetoacetate hydrolase family protein [Paenibacillus chartarius]|uniref:Fumarylacetoacetate hydrolase family protein n=1 Tax=Paenibacillus chartarius TaxID=747481 RepID=A0ABV6DH19_9BACL